MIASATLRRMDATQLEQLTVQLKASQPLSAADLELLERARAELQLRRAGWAQQQPRRPRNQQQDSLEGYVYLMFSPATGYKIGYSNQPQRRLNSIKTANPGARLLHTIRCTNMYAMETELKNALREHPHQREWYDLPDDIVNALRALRSEVELLEYCKGIT